MQRTFILTSFKRTAIYFPDFNLIILIEKQCFHKFSSLKPNARYTELKYNRQFFSKGLIEHKIHLPKVEIRVNK